MPEESTGALARSPSECDNSLTVVLPIHPSSGHVANSRCVRRKRKLPEPSALQHNFGCQILMAFKVVSSVEPPRGVPTATRHLNQREITAFCRRSRSPDQKKVRLRASVCGELRQPARTVHGTGRKDRIVFHKFACAHRSRDARATDASSDDQFRCFGGPAPKQLGGYPGALMSTTPDAFRRLTFMTADVFSYARNVRC